MGFLRNHNKGYKWLQNLDKLYIDRFGTFFGCILLQQNTTNLVPLLTMREILKMANNFSQLAKKSLKILANNY